MARLAFGGFDFGHEHADGLTNVATGTGWTFSCDASVTRNGRGFSAKCAAPAVAASGASYARDAFTGVAGTGYFGRCAFYLTTNPSAAVALGRVGTNGSLQARLNTDGTISFLDSSSNVLTTTGALALNAWHVLEFQHVGYSTAGSAAGQGQWAAARLDGVQHVALQNVASLAGAANEFRYGIALTVPLGSSFTVWLDDWARNDDTGVADNSWVGSSELVTLLLPTSDNAVGADWRKGDSTTPGGTAYDAVNNTPPTGKASASATANDQIRDAVSNAAGAASQADFTLQTYAAGGVGVADTVTFVRAVAEEGANSSTTPTSALQLVSNPAEGTETTFAGTALGAAGTYPATWRLIQNAIIAAPTVTVGTAPVLRFAKRTATTNQLYACAVGVYVAYVPAGTVYTDTPAGTVAVTGSATDSHGFGYVDTATGTVTATGASTDALQHAASPTGAAALTGTASDDFARSDAPAGAVVFAGTIIESWASAGTYDDAPVGAIVLTGTVVESWSQSPGYDDAPTGTVVFTGALADLFLPPAPNLAVGHGLGSGLFVELTTLHYPDTAARVLAVCQQFDGLEVAIPLNDTRTAKVTLGIYDEAVWKPVRDYLESKGEDELAYAVCLRVRYYDLPVFWGPVTMPEWNGGPAAVTLNAVGPELRLQHQYLKDGDPTSSGPLAESGKYAMSTEGLRFLRDAGVNEPADDAHNVPDIGIADGSEAVVPDELSPIPRLTFKRHDEIFRAMQELGGHELAPDFEIAPALNVAGAYAKLNCYFPQGTDRTGAIRLYYGFGPDNLADFTSTPGGKIVTRATYVSSDDKVRKRATAWGSASFRGVYGSVEATDYDSTTDSVGEALTLRAKQEVRKYRVPPKFVKVTMKPEAAIDDARRRHRYGRDFLVGDIVYVNAKKGWMRYDGDARITKVTLRQTDAGVVPDLELVPDVGDGNPDTGDGE